MSDKRGQYSTVPTDEHDQSRNQQLLTQGFQPPPYTPSTAPSSPYIESQHAVAGPSSGAAHSGLYPQIYDPAPQQPYHPTYQYQNFADTSKPPPAVPVPHMYSNQGPSVMASPLILTRPPGRIEDLKAKPGVVVCQHCNYLVLTETTPENGSCTYLSVLGLLLAGITSCGCCLLPFCITSCKDMMHSCPNCHQDIGLYSKIKERTFPVRRD
ncbi:hypothetical protein BGZ98_007352 [Dissophora globulifera]|nr:hypothetical protein BGZ98_007352 [Dissophora globulifera]